jgi:hypothetical protein
MLVATGSCTYDYFEDETNFRLYVPQIERGEISRFYVSFHRMDGRDEGEHVLTREVSAPFDQNETLQQGILKFKLPPGQYEISTFADYDPDMISMGEHLSASRKIVASYGTDPDTYALNNTQPRALFLRGTTVYPINHPDGQIPVEADIDEECRFKGRILCRFLNLPSSITSAEVTYRGLATRYDFDGVFRRFTDGDALRDSHPITTSGNATISNYIYPSTGVSHGADNGYIDNGLPIELSIAFYGGSSRVGEASFTSADLATIDPANLPKRNGIPVTDELLLYPRDEVEFLFKDWVILGIDLHPWGEINSGGTTIH